MWLDDDLNWVVGGSTDMTAEMEVIVHPTWTDFAYASGPLRAEFTDLTTSDDNDKRRISDPHGVGNHPFAEFLVEGLDFWLSGFLDSDTGILDFSTEEQGLILFSPRLADWERRYGEFGTLEGQFISNDVLVVSGVGAVGQLDEDAEDDCSFPRVTLPTLPTLPTLAPTTTCVQTEGLLRLFVYLRRT